MTTSASPNVLAHLLTAGPVVTALPDGASWWRHYRQARASWLRPIDVAMACGFSSDRLAWAFAGGYQSALSTLLPELPGDAPAAFCVSEAGHTDGQQYRTRVRQDGAQVGLVGVKSWIASGPESTTLLVLAQLDDSSPESRQDRGLLRLVQLDSRSAGVSLEPLANPKMLPELPQARGRFQHVVLPAAAMHDKDAVQHFVRPFRVLEPLFVNAAVIAGLLREGRARAWSPRLLERMLLLLAALQSLACANPREPAAELILAGVLEGASQLYTDVDLQFGSRDDDMGQRWLRDRKLLAAFTSARGERANRAWQRLAGR